MEINSNLQDCIYNGQSVDKIVYNGNVIWERLKLHPLQYIDLGLPSGNLWLICNLGADTPYESGKVFLYGATVGYYAGLGAEEHSYLNTWPFNDGTNTFNSAVVSANIKNYLYNNEELQPKYDAVRVATNGKACIPYALDFEELVTYTNISYGSSVVCENNGKSLIFPTAERCLDGSLSRGLYYRQLSPIYMESREVDITEFYATEDTPVWTNQGYSAQWACAIRGVIRAHKNDQIRITVDGSGTDYNLYYNGYGSSDNWEWSIVSGDGYIKNNHLVIYDTSKDTTIKLLNTEDFNWNSYTISGIASVTHDTLTYSIEVTDNDTTGFSTCDLPTDADGNSLTSLTNTLWFKSNNLKLPNSYSYARIWLRGKGTPVIYIYSDAESSYDYVVAGNLDVSLNKDYSTTTGKDTTKSFLKTLKALTYPTISDDNLHFIDIIFRKDSSVDRNSDTGWFGISLDYNISFHINTEMLEDAENSGTLSFSVSAYDMPRTVLYQNKYNSQGLSGSGNYVVIINSGFLDSSSSHIYLTDTDGVTDYEWIVSSDYASDFITCDSSDIEISNYLEDNFPPNYKFNLLLQSR